MVVGLTGRSLLITRWPSSEGTPRRRPEGSIASEAFPSQSPSRETFPNLLGKKAKQIGDLINTRKPRVSK